MAGEEREVLGAGHGDGVVLIERVLDRLTGAEGGEHVSLAAAGGGVKAVGVALVGVRLLDESFIAGRTENPEANSGYFRKGDGRFTGLAVAGVAVPEFLYIFECCLRGSRAGAKEADEAVDAGSSLRGAEQGEMLDGHAKGFLGGSAFGAELGGELILGILSPGEPDVMDAQFVEEEIG